MHTSFVLNGNSSQLNVCLIPYTESLSITVIWMDNFLWNCWPFYLEYLIKKFIHATLSFVLNGNSSRLCMLGYYHMKIPIFLQQFGLFLLKLSSIFILNISSICLYAQLPLYLQWEILKTLLITILRFTYTTVWSDHNLKVGVLYHLAYFIKELRCTQMHK